MKITTVQGVFEEVQIRVLEVMPLPEHAAGGYPIVHAGSPRLAHPDQTADFVKVVEAAEDACE